jgi:mono/diheme cytochrome c family protein
MFRHLIRSLVVSAALAPCLSWAGNDDEIARGQQIAEDNCARCHAVGPEGDSPYEPAPPFRTFGEKWPPSYLAEALAEGIVVGHPEMPEFTFDEPDIDALIAYLESLNPS